MNPGDIAYDAEREAAAHSQPEQDCCDLAAERQLCTHADARCHACCDRHHQPGEPYRCPCGDLAVDGGLCAAHVARRSA